MKRGVKIAIGIGSALLLAGTTYYFYINRVPNIDIGKVNWDLETFEVKAGGRSLAFSKGLDMGTTLQRGNYSVETSTDGSKVTVRLKNKKNQVIDRLVIDFEGKIKY